MDGIDYFRLLRMAAPRVAASVLVVAMFAMPGPTTALIMNVIGQRAAAISNMAESWLGPLLTERSLSDEGPGAPPGSQPPEHESGTS